MKLFDLSHTLSNNTPVYPGMNTPSFQPVATMMKDGYRETRLDFDSHTGTHIDAPAHMLPGGKTLDQLPVSAFTGSALIIPVPEKTKLICKDTLLKFEERLKGADFVLFNTGWSKYWGSPRYFEDFPTLATDATGWLLSFPLKGIGFDNISADPVGSAGFPNHHSIFEKGLIIIENLIFPEGLPDGTGTFHCYPLPVEEADGSPVRAVFGI